MISFLKSFFANEKSPEEQGLPVQKPRDVMTVGGYEMDGEEEPSGCAPRGCGGCGCG